MSALAAVLGSRPVRRPVRAVLRTWLSLEASGVAHVPDEGGVILAASHTTHADSLALGAAVPRPLSFLGAAHLASAPVIGPALPALGMVPVERGGGDLDVLDDLARLLRGGAALVLYPEGSRSRSGEVHRPRSGVARLALSTGVPVVPVGITGSAAAWPVDGGPRVTGSRRTTVAFGTPLPTPGPTPRDRRAWLTQLHDELVRLSGRPRRDALAPVGGAA